MTNFRKCLTVAVAGQIFASLASAGPLPPPLVIYDNAAVPNGAAPSDAAGETRADDFLLLPEFTTITAIRWTGLYGAGTPSGADKFTIQFFENEFGVPPALDLPRTVPYLSLAITAANLTRTPLEGSAFQYQATIDPLVLSPITSYWISILNDSRESPIPQIWAWQLQSPLRNSNTIAVRNESPEWSGALGIRMDFELVGLAPEPSTWTLAIAAVCGLAAGHRAGVVRRPARRTICWAAPRRRLSAPLRPR